MKASIRLAVVMPLLAIICACARNRTATIDSMPLVLEEEHCWWAVLRTDRPVDSVAARFERAYRSLGFRSVRRLADADTAWVNSGPTGLPDLAHDLVYQSRVVAYNAGDSTHFMYYISMPARDSAAITTESPEHPGPITLCSRVSAAVGFRWSRLVQPDGEEKLPVWRDRYAR